MASLHVERAERRTRTRRVTFAERILHERRMRARDRRELAIQVQKDRAAIRASIERGNWEAS